MPNAALSDAYLRSLQPPAKGQMDVWDSTLPGFGIRVSQGGSKTFVVNIDKVRRAIGRYPIVKLAEARTEAKRLFAERTLGKVRPQSITYEQATKVFLEEKGERRRARTVADHTRHLGLLNFKCQLADVNHAELERKLKRLPPSEFNHRLACAKTFFRWAQRKRYRDDDPTLGLSPHTRPTRARVLSDAELQCIWRACEQTGGADEQPQSPNAGGNGRITTLGAENGIQPVFNKGELDSAELSRSRLPRLPTHFASIVKLLILTGQRRGEIAALRTDYFSNDTCTLPPSLTKNKREHTFPLGALSKTLITPIISTGTGLLFPARRNSKPATCFNGWSKSKAALDKLSGVSDWTLHDLRRTFATRLAELGVAPHVIERLLNHVTGTLSPLSRVYNRATYLQEMGEAIDLWEARVRDVVLS